MFWPLSNDLFFYSDDLVHYTLIKMENEVTVSELRDVCNMQLTPLF